MSIIDVAQRRVVRTMMVPGNPRMALLSPDGSLLYTTEPASNRVLAIQASNGTLHCSAMVPGQPSVLALSPQGDALYVAGQADAHVSVLDPQSCKPLHRFATPGPVAALGISLLGGAFPTHTGLYQLWVATADRVIAYDTDGRLLAQFAVDGAQGFCIPNNNFAVYVSTRQGTVVAIDLELHQVTAPLLQNSAIGTMDYNAATGEIYVPDIRHQQILVLSPITPGQTISTGTIAQRIAMDGSPVSVAITSDGQLGFVALQDGRVAMFDVPGRKLITTITVGGQPHFIITGLYPPTPAQPPAQNTPASFSIPWRTLLFAFFVTLFCASCIGLLWLLVFQRKKHSPEQDG
jgi:DNA-binding beta-propeller fold protein YncE